jgi:predicted RNA-binding protein with PIN domain
MTRLYLVDAYNVILQDTELNEVLDYEGLAAARRAMRDVTEAFARATGCHVRLVFDGAQDPFSHIENFENEWVEVSFTSGEEKADERVVAIALECRRRGVKPTVVSDDVRGVREPLETGGFPLLATRRFASLLRSRRAVELRGDALSDASRKSIEDEFLARDAESRRLRELEAARRSEARSSAPVSVSKKPDAPKPPPVPPHPPVNPTRAVTAPVPARTAPDNDEKKARGQRKQARRLALLQSRRNKS